MKDKLILGIETSCDETSAAVVKNGGHVLSNVISSQVEFHSKYGGVVPEIASRKHVELIIPVIDEAIKEAGIKLSDLDGVGVTYGPGLVGTLLVGVSAAKGLSFSLDRPLIGVHHIEGHICANYIEHKNLKPPFISLVVSGGHSHIYYVEDYGKFEVLGQTRDDAAGEAFDKIARVMDLGYPGGPEIDKISKNGDENAISFPRTYFSDNSLDFSFSGIKTAVINYINTKVQKKEQIAKQDICASFQKAVVEVLANNTIKAGKVKNISKITIAGGVASNSRLRSELCKKCRESGYEFYYPSSVLCTDNAAMIASAAFYRLERGIVSDYDLNAVPGLKIG